MLARFALAAAAAMLSFAPSALQAATPSWAIPAELKTVDVGGYPMAYSEAGAGVPVVFIHGIWVDYRLYKGISAPVAAKHRLILPSLRHHYPEPWDGKGEPISFRQHAADVAALIKSLNAGKVHVVGHSMGGAVAVEVARTAPDLIRTLVLVDPGGPPALLGDDAVRGFVDVTTRRADGVRGQLESGAAREAAAAFGWNATAGPGAFEKMPPHIQQMLADNVGTIAATPEQNPPGLECGGQPFAFPVLLIHGERSPKYFTNLGEALRKCRGGIAAPVVVPNGGHNMHMDNPAAFNEALIDFFSKN